MTETVYASFPDVTSAGRAIAALMDLGASPDDVSLIAQHRESPPDQSASVRTATAADQRPPAAPYDPRLHGEDLVDVGAAGARNVAGAPAAAYRDRPEERIAESGADGVVSPASSSPEVAPRAVPTTPRADAEAGAEKGAVLGLGLGFLALLAAVFVPGVGFVAGGGALATAIAGALGATAAGAVAGGVFGYLRDQGVPPERAAVYESAYREGDALVSVHVPSNGVDVTIAIAVLCKHGGADIGIYGADSERPAGVRAA